MWSYIAAGFSSWFKYTNTRIFMNRMKIKMTKVLSNGMECVQSNEEANNRTCSKAQQLLGTYIKTHLNDTFSRRKI